MSSFKVIFDRDSWQEIFNSLQKNKMRTIITVIGVVWGIFIYVVLAGSSNGLSNGFEKEFRNISQNSMFVWAQRTSIPYDGFKIGRSPQLTLDDVTTLTNTIPEIELIAPRVAVGVFGDEPALVINGDKSGNYAIYGDFPVYVKIATKKIFDGGRFLNEEDIKYERKVCVIGERTQLELFEQDVDPIGKFITINDVSFQVIGVHKYIEGGGFDSDSDIFIPFTTFRKLYNTANDVDWFTIAAYDDADVVAVEEQVKATLRRVHRVSPKDERAFGSFNLGEIFGRILGFSNGISFLSLIVGLATILAGVIGIGNILLISVKERTKELGVRRALGATPNEVRLQIILESVFLTFLAGVIGIVLGSFVLAIINKMTAGDSDFPYTNPTVSLYYIGGALFIMVTLGTLIGLIPAQRAVKIKPIEALREE